MKTKKAIAPLRCVSLFCSTSSKEELAAGPADVEMSSDDDPLTCLTEHQPSKMIVTSIIDCYMYVHHETYFMFQMRSSTGMRRTWILRKTSLPKSVMMSLPYLLLTRRCLMKA